MFNEILKVADFIWKSILHVWPYLLIAVPAAVLVKMSGISKYIGKAFNKKPFVSILLATIVGAFSPFCSCSVIPVIASLLIGGVPLAPVMSFWLASPSMDPEIFFLSVSILGWKLAIWRLASAFIMSFAAGLITYYLTKKKWITEEATLKAKTYSPGQSNWGLIKNVFARIKNIFPFPDRKLVFADNGITIIKNNYNNLQNPSSVGKVFEILSQKINCCGREKNKIEEKCECGNANKQAAVQQESSCCDESKNPIKESRCGCESDKLNNIKNNTGCCGENKSTNEKENISRKLFRETFGATNMVIKFMLLAYFLEAIIILYLPEQFVSAFAKGNGVLSIFYAALIGIPVYTSTMPALALVAGLIGKGMAPAAGLAFLISGPTTTIPAMAAVWNLTNKKVFFLYIGFTLAGAILSGLLFGFTEFFL